MKNLSGKMTISRPSYGSGEEWIEISLTDNLSRTEFVIARVSYEDFTKAITGQGDLPVEFDANLKNVGLKIETKELVFLLPDGLVGGSEAAEKVCQKFASEGWIANTYFNSQNSIRKHNDGFWYAHGRQYRYVKNEVLTKNEEEL